MESRMLDEDREDRLQRRRQIQQCQPGGVILTSRTGGDDARLSKFSIKSGSEFTFSSSSSSRSHDKEQEKLKKRVKAAEEKKRAYVHPAEIEFANDMKLLHNALKVEREKNLVKLRRKLLNSSSSGFLRSSSGLI